MTLVIRFVNGDTELVDTPRFRADADGRLEYQRWHLRNPTNMMADGWYWHTVPASKVVDVHVLGTLSEKLCFTPRNT
jgi:hypothetical protein